MFGISRGSGIIDGPGSHMGEGGPGGVGPFTGRVGVTGPSRGGVVSNVSGPPIRVNPGLTSGLAIPLPPFDQREYVPEN